MNIRPVSQILVIDLDGLGEPALSGLLERALLPNLALFFQKSSSGKLFSGFVADEMVAFASLLTGRFPYAHNIYDREFLEPKTHAIHPVSAGQLQAKAIPEWLQASGLSYRSFGMPQDIDLLFPRSSTHPLAADEKNIRFVDRCMDGKTARKLDQFRWKRRPRSIDELEQNVSLHMAQTRLIADQVLSEPALEKDAVLHVRFPNLGPLQKFFWPEFEVDETASWARPDWLTQIEKLLRTIDTQASRLIEWAQAQGMGTIVLSDHSYAPASREVNVNGILRIHGIQRHPGLAAHMRRESFNRLAQLRRTLRSLRGLQSGRTFAESITCDWQRSLAAAPFGQNAGLVYLTDKACRQEGRAERATREVAEIFRLFADPDSGQAAFSQVITVADRWGIDPRATGWPDMIAIPAQGFEPIARWPYKEKVRVFEQSTGHYASMTSNGFMAIGGPGVAAQSGLRGQLQDFVPTVLKWLNLPVPEGLDGQWFGSPTEHAVYQPHIRPNASRTVVINGRTAAQTQFPVS